MALTPSDVVDKQFTSDFRKRYYVADEVDAFLDEVESELRRLLQDNDGLRSRAADPDGPLAPGEGQEAALRTLLLAQRTADQVVAEAEAEAAAALGAAREQADTALSEARAQAAAVLSAAHQQADAVLGPARAEADRLLTEAGRRSKRVHEEISARTAAALGELDARRVRLEERIASLRAFEREYRTRLRALLEAQMHDLEVLPEDTDPGGTEGPGTAPSATGGAVASPLAVAEGH